MIKNINIATKEEFENLDYFRPKEDFNGVVIIPTNELHVSGYRCMKFALINHGEVVGCVGGYCDIIHLNGIGGYGKFGSDFSSYVTAVKTDTAKRADWCIDCLPNGLLRLFCSKTLCLEDFIGSDFILYVN